MILQTFFQPNSPSTFRDLARSAKISHATLYRHHANAQSIAADYEAYLLHDFAKIVRKISAQESLQARSLFFHTLVFIILNQKIFLALLKYTDSRIIEKMIDLMRPELVRVCKFTNNRSAPIFEVYKKSASAIIEEWSKTGFKNTEFGKVLSNLAYLSSHAKADLDPLLD